jgi:hypothetical protein
VRRRKWILQDDITKEIEFIKEKFGTDFPFTGFASFGEFGPVHLETVNIPKLIFTCYLIQ